MVTRRATIFGEFDKWCLRLRVDCASHSFYSCFSGRQCRAVLWKVQRAPIPVLQLRVLVVLVSVLFGSFPFVPPPRYIPPVTEHVQLHGTERVQLHSKSFCKQWHVVLEGANNLHPLSWGHLFAFSCIIIGGARIATHVNAKFQFSIIAAFCIWQAILKPGIRVEKVEQVAQNWVLVLRNQPLTRSTTVLVSCKDRQLLSMISFHY